VVLLPLVVTVSVIGVAVAPLASTFPTVVTATAKLDVDDDRAPSVPVDVGVNVTVSDVCP
jgi:hypothetical protein